MHRAHKRYSEDTDTKLKQLAEDLSTNSIVTQCLARYIHQVLEFVFDEYIHPLHQERDQLHARINELEHQVRVLGGKP